MGSWGSFQPSCQSQHMNPIQFSKHLLSNRPRGTNRWVLNRRVISRDTSKHHTRNGILVTQQRRTPSASVLLKRKSRGPPSVSWPLRHQSPIQTTAGDCLQPEPLLWVQPEVRPVEKNLSASRSPQHVFACWPEVFTLDLAFLLSCQVIY